MLAVLFVFISELALLFCPAVIAIRADDPLASKLNDVEDIERCVLYA